MKLALVQLAVWERAKEDNIRRGLELSAQAACGRDLVVLPEVWTTGYSLGHLAQEAERLDGPLVRELQALAAREGCAIVAGSVPLYRGGLVYNSSLAIDKRGALVHVYDKVHLFGLFQEQDFFAPGQDFSAYWLDGVKCGSTICYDLRFPELYRHLALQGAELFLCPAEWPTVRGDAWRLLAQARAAENHAFLVGVNCAGSFKGAPFYGHSLVVDPLGRIVAEAGEEEAILTCEIDLGQVEKVRQRLNALLDVRKELIS